MSLVTIRLHEKDAEEAARAKDPGLRRVQEALRAELARRAKKAERKVARKRALKLPTPAPKSGGWPTLKLRKAVWERSEGRCENPRCRRLIRWHTFDLEHLLGRGKAAQAPENTWALCNPRALDAQRDVACHPMKTANVPSRAHWLEVFLEFARPRFAGSATVALVEGQLEAERAGAELDAMRQRAQKERRCALAGEKCPNGAPACAPLGPGEEDLCYGCRSYVCSNHEAGLGMFGGHEVTAHLGRAVVALKLAVKMAENAGWRPPSAF